MICASRELGEICHFSFDYKCCSTNLKIFKDPIYPSIYLYLYLYIYTDELGYPGPLYAGLLAMIDNMLGPSPMHITNVYWTMRRLELGYHGPISRHTHVYICFIHMSWNIFFGNFNNFSKRFQ